MSRYDEMNSMLEELEPDINKFYEKGNKAAGTRARKTLQAMKKKAQEIRLEIQDMKNNGDV
ncbi:MAG TPA: histone H1 [Balneolaceae bacterium]